MERDPVDLERELKDVIRRAKGNPDKTGSLRRDTLKRLIKLTHSSHPNLKILAAQNIRYLFNDFPELEEEAINAIYDLCEDQTSKVRIEGYTAITHLSNAGHRLIRRNADVLLQLLQSDEADEVNVVRKALTEHLDMDPKVTLSVLCDQIAPLDDSVDEEERMMRDRLRDVVLKFLTGARRAIVERHALPGSDAEEALIESLIAVIPKLGFSDVEIIVRNLLIPLKAYQGPSARGHALLQALLNKVAEHLQKGARSGDVSILHLAQPYLDLAAFVVVEKQAAPAIELLRFYCSSISTKITLQNFSKDDQRLVVSRLAETLVAANDHAQPEDDGVPLETLRRQVVDSCPFLLESLRLSPTSPERSVNAAVFLLRACLQRKRNTHWTLPPNLIATLSAIQTTVTKEQSQDVYNLIRSLVPPPRTSEKVKSKPTSQNITAATVSQAAKKTTNGLPASLPERPPASYPARRMHIASSSRPPDRDQVMADPLFSQGPASRSAKHQLASEPSSRPLKRQKGSRDDDGDTDAGPSLLSRLGTTLSGAPMSRASPQATPRNVAAAQTPHAAAADQLPPNGEWSIKGAAKLGGHNAAAPTTRNSISTPSSSSLLQRLEGGSTSMGEDRSGWARRKGRS